MLLGRFYKSKVWKLSKLSPVVENHRTNTAWEVAKRKRNYSAKKEKKNLQPKTEHIVKALEW